MRQLRFWKDVIKPACRYCGRRLREALSVRRGVGPKCWEQRRIRKPKAK